MELNNQTTRKLPFQSICSVAHLLLSTLVCAALFLGQTIPVMASTANSATWVEICGDGGSYLIQIDANGIESTGDTGPKEMPACVHCDTCLLAPFETQNIQPSQIFPTDLTDFRSITFSITRSVVTERPEQYWSACRGPPIASTENNMTTRHLSTQSFISSAAAATVTNTGGLPWV